MIPLSELIFHKQGLRLNTLGPTIQNIQKNSINRDAFLNWAIYHSIQPQAYELLRNATDVVVSPEVLQHLQESAKAIALRQMANVREFFRIQQLLQAEGITAVPYKGFWLAHSAYGDFTKRESSDVDLYIESEDIYKVQSIMFGLGYISEVGAPIADPLLILQYNGECNFDKFEGDNRLFHIEFHAFASSDKLGLKLGIQDLQDQIINESFQGWEIQVFSPSAQLLLTVLHHGGKDAWSSLKQVLDVGYLVQQHPNDLDWRWIQTKAQQHDVARLLWVGLGLAQRLTGLELPASLLPAVQQKKIQRLIRQRVRILSKAPQKSDNAHLAYARRLWFLWRCRERWSSRTRLLQKHLEPSPWNSPPELHNKPFLLQLAFRVKTLMLKTLNK